MQGRASYLDIFEGQPDPGFLLAAGVGQALHRVKQPVGRR